MAMHPRRVTPGKEPWKLTLGKNPRIPPDLVDYLKENFTPRCIRTGETMEDHLRYAGKVELAEKLIAMAAKGDDQPDFMIQED